MPALPPHPDHLRLAFVDLETTGTSAISDRITEIGIITVDDTGVEEWSTLVNPEVRIPEFIQGLTGIDNAMVAQAPTFAAIADEVGLRLANRIFVAHNARFDHGFLKNAFKRLSIDFAPRVLCTVKLSRKLFPGFGRHSLDALVERHRLVVSERHRALGDARLIHQFWQRLRERIADDTLGAAVAELTARPALPPHIDQDLIDGLPDRPGVYLFYGDNDLPLYIGKAIKLRRRIMQHFSGDHGSSKEMDLARQVKRIEVIHCAGELEALLREAALVRTLMPIHNRKLRKEEAVYSWRVVPHSQGPRLQLATPDDLFYGQDDALYGLYATPRQAQSALRALAEAHRLCLVRLGLEKALPGKPCFASQVARCQGVCTGKETGEDHDQRLHEALEPVRLKPWPWPGPVTLREGSHLHVLDGWSYLGTARDTAEAAALASARRGVFERATYLLLHDRLDAMATDIKPLTANGSRPIQTLPT